MNIKCFIRVNILVFMIFFSLTSFSQTWEEYVKGQTEQFDEYKIQQEAEMVKLKKDYYEYVRQVDKEFSEYLKKEWEDYQSFKKVGIPKRPKPKTSPEWKPSTVSDQISTEKISVIPTHEETNANIEKPILPLIQKAEELNFNSSEINFDFYDTNIGISVDDNLYTQNFQRVSEEEISNWWSRCSNTNYNLTINQLLSIKDKLSLNDWGYFQLINKFSASLINNNANEVKLLTWFLMIRSGYNIKVAFSNNEIYLLFPSLNELYGKSYLKIGNKIYYFKDDITSNTFQTYDFDFPGATRVIDFNIYQPINIGNEVEVKQINFSYLDIDYSFPVTISVNTMQLMRDYPVTELNVFFSAAMSRVTKQSLAEGLVPYMRDMSTDEALNFLLAFVQKAFNYKTDQEQFNKEKFFFPEELFYYPGSDCEDRAALFSYLVREFLHLEVVGLEYTGHVATAVRTNRKDQGDFLIYNGHEYVIADPTYINAPLGLTMPKYKNKTAKIFEINNKSYLANASEKAWEITNDMGGYRGNNLSDSKYDSKGNCYITGYFKDDVKFADEHWHSKPGLRQPFILKYDKNNKVVWAKRLTSNNMASGFSITLDKNENPIIAGSFSGDIRANGYRLQSENNKEDIFVAALNSDGNMRWLEKAGLDTINYNQFINYVIEFDNNGKHKKTNLFLENALNTSNGIFTFDNSIKLIGGINLTVSYSTDELAFKDSSEFSTITFLKEESDALVSINVDKSVAGLMAVINLIKYSGMIIPGSAAQEALDRYNPQFSSSSPSIYENIGKVTFMKNNNGIINIKTNNNKPVSFDKIKINDGAEIKIASLQNGNEQINILSGIEVGKAFIWYNLNLVKIIQNTGDLVFDYDTDHTQKIVNMGNDILN